ncbi:hypothetical protein EAJ17_03545 [Akkermansia sp. aa_0143]|nr:hypothetical protein [Akkermansia sp.]RYT98627.1 hypothetical protein EAJ17_03545 [Akkermansia sp. aa_0143]
MKHSMPGVHGTIPSPFGIPCLRDTSEQHYGCTLTDGSLQQVIKNYSWMPDNFRETPARRQGCNRQIILPYPP